MTKQRMMLVPAGEDKPRLLHINEDWKEMAEAIGCQYVERVSTPIEGLALYCDEEFLLRSPVPAPNRVGYLLYPGPIHGNVLLCKEDRYGEIQNLNQFAVNQLCAVLGYSIHDLFITEEER